MPVSQAVAESPSPRAKAPRAPFVRGFDNLSRQHGLEPLRLEGELPKDLQGTLYRNGVGLMERFGERYHHWFDADGAVSAVRLHGGVALGAARVVQTRGLLNERRAGKRLYGSYKTPLVRPFQELFLGESKSPANTSVLAWQDRLFATCEAGLPVEVSRETLETLGETSLGVEGLVAFSAHPREAPARRAAYNFGLRLGRRTVVDLVELPHRGRARRLGSFSIDGARLLHDFIVTERHLVFVFAPLFVRSLPLLFQGRGLIESASFEPSRGTTIVVVPIDEPSRRLTLEAPAFLHEHTVNAFEDRDRIVFDFTRYADLTGLEQFVGALANGVVHGPPAGTIHRGVIDPARKTAHFEERIARPLEMPRVSPRATARRYRFAYFSGHDSAEAARQTPPDVLVKADVERAELTTFRFGPDQYPSEAVFVPRRSGVVEDDGYLLTLVYDAHSHTSHLVVLDARDPGRGPLARAHFDHAIPFGFHGVWVASA
jgi:all-trans-8'-apo-beta-carotenal 15,15'-oxygenase